ncbi:vwkA [Symbiodinium pilosum]|uniref:VwkA protein n=1 Tax=Symbiodinium pilosum TaxID=2952 RepID=A0A812JAM8_SYMPI|nr:vwkA [Symbiodinium pilosum]
MHWPCGGKCGATVQRDLQAKAYDGNFPKLVFCRSCAQKLYGSWRARVCRSPECNEYVQYKNLLYVWQGLPEPELCSKCKQQGVEGRKQEEDLWRLKKCQECNEQFEFYVPQDPHHCAKCAQKMATSLPDACEAEAQSDVATDESELSDWSVISELNLPTWKPRIGQNCEECSAEVSDQGQQFNCQSGQHCFFLCGSKGCAKKFLKKCEDSARRWGKSGKKKLDFAQHTGSSPCPSCGLLLIEEKIKSQEQSACLISSKGPTCFLWGTLMPTFDERFTLIQQLQEGDKLFSADGAVVAVKSIQFTEDAEQELLSFHTASASQLQ